MTDFHEGAKMTARALSNAVNMNLAQMMPVGVEARVYNFVHADLPVMLHHAGQPIEHITPHQKSLLDMPAEDFRRQAERNYEAAAEVLGWTAPQNEFAVKDFMGHGVLHRSTVSKMLDHYEMNHDRYVSPSQNVRNNAVIINDDRNPLAPDMFEQVEKTMRENGEFLSGMDVRVKKDSQGDVVRQIEASFVEAEGDNMYRTYHKVTGSTGKIGSNELIDNRGLEHFYGVIVEDEKGQHYMVRIEEHNANPHVLTSNVREVSGIAGSYMQSIAKNLDDALTMEDVEMPNHGKQMRATCGEFTVRNLRGYEDSKGPCMVIASPWQSKPDSREMGIAYHEVQAYKARFEQDPEEMVKLISRVDEKRVDANRQDNCPQMNPATAAAILAGGGQHR